MWMPASMLWRAIRLHYAEAGQGVQREASLKLACRPAPGILCAAETGQGWGVNKSFGARLGCLLTLAGLPVVTSEIQGRCGQWECIRCGHTGRCYIEQA